MNHQKGFIHIVVVILISVMAIGLVGAAWYFEMNKEEATTVVNTNTAVDSNTNTVANTNTTTNANIGNLDTSEWKTYRNSKYNFTIKYPNHYSVETGDYGLSLETIYEKPSGTEMFMGGNADIRVSFATDESNSGPYFSDFFVKENNNLQDFSYYAWAKNDFSEDSLGYDLLAFYDKEIVIINGNEFTVFNVASGMDNVREYFFLKDEVLIHITDTRLGGSEQELNEEIIFSIKF